MALLPDIPPHLDDIPELSAPVDEAIDDDTDDRSCDQMSDLFDFDAPTPPSTDSVTGRPTANYGHEMKVAIWRDRMTRGLQSVHAEQCRYATDEDKRHAELLGILKSRGSFARLLLKASASCGKGTLELFGTIAGNETGQLKYFALTLLGLAGIANGIAFSGFGFSAESAIQCGPGTHEVSGRCVASPED